MQAGGLGDLGAADLLLFGAVVTGAAGYTEGGMLARELGPWQTVSWALVLSAPIVTVLAVVAWNGHAPHASLGQWLSLAYIGSISAYFGFFAWYHGLAIGDMAQVSQVQLVQPVLSLIWSAVLIHERLSLTTALGGAAVIACASFAVRARTARAHHPDPGLSSEDPGLPQPEASQHVWTAK